MENGAGRRGGLSKAVPRHRSPKSRRRRASSRPTGSGPLGGILEGGLEDSDAGEVAVAFGEIEAVADDELVGDFEADEIGGEVDFAAAFFVEEDAGADAGGLQFFDDVDDDGEGFSGVEDVVDEEDVAVSEIEREAVEELRFAVGFGVVAVAGDADAIEADGVRNLAEEVGGEEDGAVDDGDDGDLFLAVDGRDLGAEFLEAVLDGGLRHEDGFEVGVSGTENGFGHGKRGVGL